MILDYLFTLLHLIIIGFNLLGWIWSSTRRLHLIFVLLTAASWFLLGIWYGIGYCPITDWQWQIKEKLGETNLPNSFIKYFADKVTHSDISSDLIDAVTAISFVLAAALSVYLNFFRKNNQQKLN
ncbi:MAG TPA: DUF2784 domain-containing protein [Pedobacter sp.]|uniref:DUF2784 domain-containing protein n=1 Tax=Pedobacter sp. TaxID=1411316 RepID=UPI002C3FB2E9|nr:DUF2784 domain-containing protein [Pedobacter sp.]HMI03858.1 DUF2784 domain-containing protein [Pedobacter sp.]